MNLTNAQYDAVMKQYDLRRLDNFHLMKKRREEAFAAIPELREIDRSVALGAVEKVRRSLAGRLSSGQEAPGEENIPSGMPHKGESAELKRRRLLREHGFPEDYLDPVFSCPYCRDTGLTGAKHCRCFDREVIRLFYSQSGLQEILQKENFDTLCMDYYPEDLKDPSSGLSSRLTMESAVRTCRRFVSQFGKGRDFLLLTGQTGLGKTFLSHCIAKELIESGHSVIYLSAGTLFERLAGAQFGRDADTALSASGPSYISECDLLIIDDLGTELTNSFTVSALFRLLNERIALGKGIIISTNLGLSELQNAYTDRISSRIVEHFTLVPLFGRDIRIRKRIGTKQEPQKDRKTMQP